MARGESQNSPARAGMRRATKLITAPPHDGIGTKGTEGAGAGAGESALHEGSFFLRTAACWESMCDCVLYTYADGNVAHGTRAKKEGRPLTRMCVPAALKRVVVRPELARSVGILRFAVHALSMRSI